MISGVITNLTAYGPSTYGSDPWAEGSYTTWGVGNRIANTNSADYRIKSLAQADVQGYIPDDTSYDYAVNVDDILYTDTNGTIYFLPGQMQLANYKDPSHNSTLEHNMIHTIDNSAKTTQPGTYVVTAVDKMVVVKDYYTRTEVPLVAGNINEFRISDNGFVSSQGFMGVLAKTSPKDVTKWSYTARLDYSTQLYDFITTDMNQDGIEDIIYRDQGLNIRVSSGLRYYRNTTDTFNSDIIVNYTSIAIKPGGLRPVDLDGDSDEDLVILTSDNRLIFMKNSLGDDVSLDFLDLQVKTPIYTIPPTSRNWVNITLDVTNQKELQNQPLLNITYMGVSEFIWMDTITSGKSYKKIYYLKGNGSYTVTVNGTDQWENQIFVTDEFFGDYDLPELTLSHNPYANGSFEIYIYNNTEAIGNNQIALNITHVDYLYQFTTDTGATYDPDTALNNKLYYMDNGTWWIRFTKAIKNGTHTISIRASDLFLVDYKYMESTILNDIEPPELAIYYGTMPSRITNLSIADPRIPLSINFTEPISYIKIWIEDNLGNNVLYGTEKFIEKTDVGMTYSAKLRSDVSENLFIKFLMIDRAGNINLKTYSFYLTPFSIVTSQNWFNVKSSTGNTDEVYENHAYVHFKGNFIYQFRLRYNGLNDSVNGAWTDWKEYDLFQDKYYHDQIPTKGYNIYFVAGEYGEKTVELQLKNSYHTITLNATKITYTIPDDGRFDPMIVVYIVGGTVGGIFVIVMIKKIASGREWKKHLAFTESG
jgi:hypothetical protein